MIASSRRYHSAWASAGNRASSSRAHGSKSDAWRHSRGGDLDRSHAEMRRVAPGVRRRPAAEALELAEHESHRPSCGRAEGSTKPQWPPLLRSRRLAAAARSGKRSRVDAKAGSSRVVERGHDGRGHGEASEPVASDRIASEIALEVRVRWVCAGIGPAVMRRRSREAQQRSRSRTRQTRRPACAAQARPLARK